MFTDRNGRPCQASDDSLVAAMYRLMPKSLEETVMFANEDEGFQELYDRLLAYRSTKQSIQMSESKKSRDKSKGKPSNAENSNWQMCWTEKGAQQADGWWKDDEQADGWWNTTDWQTKPGSGWRTTANDWTPWESEETMGQIEINSMEKCSSNSSKDPRSDGGAGDNRETLLHGLAPTTCRQGTV